MYICIYVKFKYGEFVKILLGLGLIGVVYFDKEYFDLNIFKIGIVLIGLYMIYYSFNNDDINKELPDYEISFHQLILNQN